MAGNGHYFRQKKGCLRTLFCVSARRILGQELLAVTLTELVHLLGGLQDVLLAGVKRVRLAGNFQFQQRVFVAVFPLDGFTGRDRGLRQNGEFRGNILEDDVSVFGVYVLFHDGAAQWASR